MRDLNFFEGYIEKKEFNLDKQLVYYTIFFLLLIGLISYTIFNQIKIRNITRDLEKLKMIAEDEKINERVEYITKKEKEVEKFKESLNKIKSLDDTMENDNIIDDSLLEMIKVRMPEEVFFTSISMNSEHIEMVGVSENKSSIAELGKSLESIAEFKEIFVTSISKEEEYYSFNLSISLKDVSTYGEDSIIEEDETQVETDQE